MKRTILLVDMNAFFVSCEMSRDSSLCGIPAAVAGNPQKRTGIILAANYEARAYGVKTAMTVNRALQLCPKMKLVKPDHDYYKEKSLQVMKLLADFSPVVEPNSIDEAWLDLTGCDALYSTPMHAASMVMHNIKTKLGLACSIGISENKFLAKMAAEMKKPMGITELWLDDVPKMLWPLPLSAMYGIGDKTAGKLNSFGMITIGDLASSNSQVVSSLLGKTGDIIFKHANGLDSDPVASANENSMKSIGRSVTLPEDIKDPEKLRPILLELAEDVAHTSRKHNARGNVIRLQLKFEDFTQLSRQETIRETNSGQELYKHAYRILITNWQPKWSVRLIGITITGFNESILSKQISFFDQNENTFNYSENSFEISAYRTQTSNHADTIKLDEVIDRIRDKHGAGSITKAALLKNSSAGIKSIKSKDEK